jgi:Superfamily II DNA and RNA helicases
MHGNLSQSQRERTLAAFRSGTVNALVATDVAARGVHVDDVGCVIHYDLPDDIKSYLHRSGRTARAGAIGTVVALVTPKQRAMAKNIKTRLKLDAELIGNFESDRDMNDSRRRHIPDKAHQSSYQQRSYYRSRRNRSA